MEKKITQSPYSITSGDTIFHGVYKEGVLHLMPREETPIVPEVLGSHIRAILNAYTIREEIVFDYKTRVPLSSDPDTCARLIGKLHHNPMGQAIIGLSIAMVITPDLEAFVNDPRDIQAMNDVLNVWLETHKGQHIYITKEAFVNNDPMNEVDPDHVDLLLTLLGFGKHGEKLYRRTQIVNLVQSAYSVTPSVYAKLKQLAVKTKGKSNPTISDTIEWLIDEHTDHQEKEKRRALLNIINF